jgi:diguanylate cyclase (GGDEF)-like protein
MIDYKQVEKRRFLISSAPLLIFTVSLAILLFVRNATTKTILSDLLLATFNLLIAYSMIMVAKGFMGSNRRFAAAWGAIAAGQLLYALGDVLWVVFEVLGRVRPFPSIADVFYLGYYPFFFLGIILLTFHKSTLFVSLRRVIDNCIVMLAAIICVWNFLLAPIMAATEQQSILFRVLSVAYPVGDLVLLFGVMVLIYIHPENHSPAALFLYVLGITIMIVADVIFAFENQTGKIQTLLGSNTWYLLSYLLTAWATIFQSDSYYYGSDHELVRWQKYLNLDRYQKFFTYLPSLLVCFIFGVWIWRFFHDLPMSIIQLSMMVGGIILLVLIRQVLSINEIQKLNRDLQTAMIQVKLQADELEESNRKFQIEIYERVHIEERLIHDAMHDGLTGLPNRVLFNDRMGQAIEYSARRQDHSFSVLFLDLDTFKMINDSLGHSIGDRLLVSIAHRLLEALRSCDTVARLGGDEFVVLLENKSDPEMVIKVAERIQEEIRKPFLIEDHTVYTSTSIGIVLDIAGYSTPEDVLRDADIAMYKAKAMGKARFEIFDTGLRFQVVTRLQVETELHQAIVKKQFELYYQPILSLKNDELIGFEALIRWNHPTRGLLLPAEFLEVAEDAGLMIPIGDWVLHEACQQMKQWQIENPEMKNLAINVNVSGKQFNAPDFVEKVIDVLRETELSGHHLKLEITENILIDNHPRAATIFSRLIDFGVQLEIDDFGTKYSSLSYLQNFPIHTIKIDQSFIQGIGDGGKSSELIRAIVSMAHELGMDTIAEGVETVNQLEELKRLSCSYGQGFYLSRPIPSSSVVPSLHPTTF